MDLERDYGLAISSLEPHPGGFASDCWVADGRWFVKVWPEGEQPTGLRQLGELGALGLPVVEPLRSVRGELSVPTGTRSYAVFPYLEGRTATWNDWRVAARALRQVHEAPVRVELPPVDTTEPEIRALGRQLDHPWIADRAAKLTAAIDRLDDVRARLAGKAVPQVVCHTDFHGLNLLIDDAGEVAAILDWDYAVIGPREFDLWVAADGGDRLAEFLDAYAADDLDLDHLEFALLARGLRDLSARVSNEMDRPGVETWGFDRIRNVDRNLEVFRPYCRT
ncbi:phosphotransferase enzyme family protein [Microlunatus parietis]|uniref:Ser/Thr protein kinase RdoA (MazF antagonist) n=1 Tax=Microlunatus parietis TaxID=682979 RepID=A0A7Y9LEL5_9ACTN|nr:phosphotransferase [Microlunatus parietis]NYE73171.1 Ser/Thr protein kinase RdoA (MazF antagonist) [Microlunatus parietis]